MKTSYEDRLAGIDRMKTIVGWTITWKGDNLEPRSGATVNIASDGQSCLFRAVACCGTDIKICAEDGDPENAPFPKSEEEVHKILDELLVSAKAKNEKIHKDRESLQGEILGMLREAMESGSVQAVSQMDPSKVN